MNYSILQGDCIQTMKTLPANSVQCVVTSPPYLNLRSYLPDGHPDKHLEIGGEQSVAEYVGRLVEVFREVRRVLREDGVLFLNLGDSYNGSGKGPTGHNGIGDQEGRQGFHSVSTQLNGLKPKDLIGVPWECAFALRADGWWLRQEIIWAKKAPMPESVTDRCTKAHEQVFLLTKSAQYYFDAEAIKEPQSANSHGGNNSYGGNKYAPMGGIHGGPKSTLGPVAGDAGRNKRSVWTLGPESYSGAHFATMPTKLVEPCILAGTSAHGCCANCGSPYERIVEREMPPLRKVTTNGPVGGHGLLGGNRFDEPIKTTTTGWQPTCTCNADVVPCTVIDPFLGSGTTLAVALKHGRRGIGLELNESYIELAHDRISRSQPMLLAVT